MILWTLVTFWALLVGGAGLLAWRYYSREEPAPRTSGSGRSRERANVPARVAISEAIPESS